MPNSRFDTSAVRRVYHRLLPLGVRQKLRLKNLKKLIAPSRKLYHRAIPAATRQKLRMGKYMPDAIRRQLAMMPTAAELPPPPPPPFRPVIGVVIPAYNRRENLARCLGVLSWQTMDQFVVMIADDGSTDGTREMILELKQTPFWQDRLLYVRGGPRRGVRTGRARNLGAANLPPSVRVMLKLDTDMLLSPNALAEFMRWHEWYPRAALIGQIDWLPEMSIEEVDRILATESLEGLRARIPTDIPPERVPWSLIGREYRQAAEGLDFSEQAAPALPKRTWMLPGNAAYPLDVFWQVGGYDEQLRGYGYQDLEFGERISMAEIEVVGVGASYCLHIFHLKAGGKHGLEAQRNLDYIIRKYQRMGVDPERIAFYESRVEWENWWHYNQERGGDIFEVAGELWAVNGAGTHRLKLPNAAWVRALGFDEADVRKDALENFAQMADAGVAHDPIGDRLDYWLPPHEG